MVKYSRALNIVGVVILLWGFGRFIYPQFGFVHVELSSNFNNGVSISRPKFLFPREITFQGIPLPGGDFQLVKDPHYYGDRPNSFDIPLADGSSETLRIQGFSINFLFSRSGLAENILAIESGGEIFEYDVGNFSFHTSVFTSTAQYIQVIDGKAYFYLHTANRASILDGGFILLSWPLVNETPGLVWEQDTDDWEQVVDLIQQAGVSTKTYDELCDTRWKPTRALAEYWTGSICPP